MQADYSEFPPLKYLTRVMKTCPNSALLYVQLWDKRGKNMHIETEKKHVRKEYLISPTLFRNLLAPLMYLNLIHFVENEGLFQIDVLGPQAND